MLSEAELISRLKTRLQIAMYVLSKCGTFIILPCASILSCMVYRKINITPSVGLLTIILTM